MAETSFLNGCVWTPTATGTGTWTVSAAVSPYFTPAGCTNPSVVNAGIYNYFAINGTEYEIGQGVYTAAGTTLTRATIRSSSNSGNVVNFTSAPSVYMGGPLADTVGVLSATDRQNVSLSAIYQSKLFAGYRRMVNLFADGYKASDGINAGASSNYTLSTTNGRFENTSSPVLISQATGTAFGDIATRQSASFDSNTNQANSASSEKAGTGGYIGKNYTGVAKKIVQVKAYAPNNTGYDATGTPTLKTLTVYAKNGGAPASGTDGTNLGSTTSSTVADVNTIASNDQTTLWDYVWLNITGASGSFIGIAELELYEPSTVANMTVVTTAQTSVSMSRARALVEYNPVDSISLNTDLTIEVTCNGGSNWTMATLAAVTVNSQAGRDVAETNAEVCTAGTSFQARVKSLNNKAIQVYGLSLQVS